MESSNEHMQNLELPLEIRDLDGALDGSLDAWVHERLGRQLGKYLAQIERIHVRFGDENGPKGGIDRNCMIHVVLSALPPVVVEMRAGEDREAFDLAAGRTERALKKMMQKHGFSNKHKGRQRRQHAEPDQELVQASLEDAGMLDGDDEADAPLFAARNTKGHDDGMTYALEDTTQARPSRKSTRASSNHIKHGQQLALRTRNAVHSPQMHAARANRG